MDETKAWYKSKTMWLGTVVILLGGVETALQGMPIPEPWGGVALSVLGAAIMFLRKISNTPIA